MTGYRIGTQAWYDATRKRLIDISKELRKSELPQNNKNRLYKEQANLMDALYKYADDKLVNNPLE